MRKAVFLDRDGVLNRKAPEGHYVTRWEDMEFLPGVHEAVRALNEAGYFVVIASNQRCVAKGLISTSELEALHARMSEDFAAAGARIDAIYYCPHDFQPSCNCRKPQPGMLLDAARTHQLDLARSWMIGDSAHDVEAGRRAGCRTIRIWGRETAEANTDELAYSLRDAAQKVLEQDRHLRRADTIVSKSER